MSIISGDDISEIIEDSDAKIRRFWYFKDYNISCLINKVFSGYQIYDISRSRYDRISSQELGSAIMIYTLAHTYFSQTLLLEVIVDCLPFLPATSLKRICWFLKV